MPKEADIWKDIANATFKATNSALNDPVTRDHILSPEQLAIEEDMSMGHVSAFSISASLNIIRHNKAVQLFGNPHTDQPKPAC